MDVEELRIILEAEIGDAVKNLRKAQKVVEDFGKEMDKQTKKSKKWYETWKKEALLISAVSIGAMYAMIKASPTLSVEMYEMRFQFERLAYVMGEQLGPAFEAISDVIGTVVDIFISLPKPVQQFIAVAIGLTAVIGIAIPLISSLGSALGALLGPVGLIIIAVALLYVAWQNNWFGIRDKTKAVIDWLKKAIPTFLSNIKLAWNKTVTFLKAIWTSDWKTIENVTKGVLDRLPGPIRTFLKLQLKLVTNYLGFMKAVFRGDWQAAAGYVKDAIQGILNFINDLKDWMIKAGENLVKWFLEGFEKAKEWAADQIKNFTDWIASFFGGSLPERGPLRNIVEYGKELAHAFSMGISTATGREAPITATAPFIGGGGGTVYNIVHLEPRIELSHTTATTSYEIKSMLREIVQELLAEHYRRTY